MNKKELREILEKHKKWLNNEEGGKRADLSYADLRNADLRNADLRAADLRAADLSYADLRYANLRAADLREADLSYADLRAADLRYAYLRNADLRAADLREADLSYADLSNADLRYANLDYSVLPLWCGSVKTHFDDKQIIQFIYHTTKAGLYSKNVSTEIKEELKKLAPLWQINFTASKNVAKFPRKTTNREARTLDKLKQALFEEALYHKRHYQRCRKLLGEFDFLTLTHEGHYKTVYGIIVEGDCENEFLAWEQEMQQGG